MALFLIEDDVKRLLTMDVAIEAVEESFRQLAFGDATNTPRSRATMRNGALNVMSAVAPGLGVMGLKAYGVVKGAQVRFYVQLFSTDTGELLALIEASEMGRIRTGAASGVATRHMARRDASTVGIIGAGYQSFAQLEAVCASATSRPSRCTPAHRSDGQRARKRQQRRWASRRVLSGAPRSVCGTQTSSSR